MTNDIGMQENFGRADFSFPRAWGQNLRGARVCCLEGAVAFDGLLPLGPRRATRSKGKLKKVGVGEKGPSSIDKAGPVLQLLPSVPKLVHYSTLLLENSFWATYPEDYITESVLELFFGRRTSYRGFE